MCQKTPNEMEREIASLFIDTHLNAGHAISVFDGEETVVHQSTDKTEILTAMFSTDQDTLLVWQKAIHWEWLGNAMFVYGNDGWDVIADYHTSLTPWMEPIDALADKLEAQS